jgi:sugar lactone lactonase YvrE
MGAYWVDYDQDGFLDLFVQDHAGGSAAPNHLYRNNGATNAWLTVKCVGTSSPRFGTGAKVHAYATSCGRPLWQLRLIDAGGTCWGGQSFEANFGLGDALVVDTLRIEWPSGLVQELHNIPAKQILTVTEPPRLIQVVRTNPTQIQLAVKSWTGFQYRVEASSDLVHWEGLGLVTNLNGTIEIDDPQASSSPHRFYRLALPRTETVATFVPPAFPEGIAADRQGNVYVSVVPTGEIRRIAPDGTQSAFAQVPATSLAAGLTLDGDGNLYVAVAPMPPDPAKHGVWKVTPNGTASLFAALPPESLPNDVAFDAHGTLFVTDSIGGKIFHIDAQGQTSEWVVTPLLLGPPNPQPPHPPFPIGANGLAFAGTNVFVCNSDLGTIVQVPVNPDGTAGTSEVFADDPRLFGPDGIKADAQGNLYVASVVQNLILRVSPQKNIEVLADVADGLDSPSSLCFGATATQRTSLFVVNYALVSAMTPGGTPRPGIVRIEVGFVGR